jgi:tRNA (mo5U34)-methyltransferase
MQTGLGHVEKLGPWFHNLHLPDGTQTAPDHALGDFPSFKWRQIAPLIPEDLRGWRVLDIGCNGGYYTVALAQRGAEVLAIDIDRRYLDQARWAVRVFGLEDRVTVRQMEVYDVAAVEKGFDLILFMGVFYHLRYPLLALDLVAAKVSRLFVFQTLTMPGDEILTPEPDYTLSQREVFLEPGWPKMAFVEHQFAADPTNWWVPNAAAVEAMLRSAGLRVLHRLDRETYVCEPGGAGHREFQRQGYWERDAALARRARRRRDES